MKLLVQPGDGIGPLVSAMKKARKSIDIVIFRLDWKELENALEAAARRGIAVRALIAHTNRGGEQKLRALEMRLLEAGVTVGRTADDLTRYHGKMMIIDRRTLFVLSFNFVHMDIDHSRGFGIVTSGTKAVQEAVKLFEADLTRQSYSAGLKTFIVSPVNARQQLSSFIKKARKQLLIYDPKIADKQMIRLLLDRAKAGVEIRIIGGIDKENTTLRVWPLTIMRLHTRTIIVDRREAFVGSQSLRQPELDSRREIGIILREPKVVNTLLATFERDWALLDLPDTTDVKNDYDAGPPKNKEKAVKAHVKKLRPLATTVEKAIHDAVTSAGHEPLGADEMKATVKDAIREAVKEAVREMAQEKQEPS